MQEIFDDYYCDCMYFHYRNLCGPRKSGKTSWLKAIMEYHSENHPIIFLDLSDCYIACYEDFLRYIAKKMSDLYVEIVIPNLGKLYNAYEVEACVDIVEGNTDEQALKRSLSGLIHILDFRIGKKSDRPMIFIDDISSPVLYSVRYGFYDNVKAFLDEFLDIDHYEFTGGIFTTSYSPANVAVDYSFKYISNRSVNGVEPLFKYCNENGINLEPLDPNVAFYRFEFLDVIDLSTCCDKFFSFSNLSNNAPITKICFDEQLRLLLIEKRNWIKSEYNRMEREVREYKERERIEYASPFESVGWIPSEYVGIRELHIQNYDDRKVEKLNNLLKDLHDKTKGELSGRTVYDIIQGLDRNQSFLYDSTSLLKRLKEYALSNSKVSYCNITDDDYWAFFDVKCNGCSETCVDMSLIKVYLTLDIIEKIEAGFEKVVRHLIDSTTTMFHAKVTKVKRDDQICLWVSREDFFLLEQFVNINEGIFRSPLPFVAYRGKLGLSREFYDWTSHNAVQARLINDYFAVVNSKEDINIFDMYALYVKAWNGELPDNHLFAQLYKKSNAQELLILLETFSIIIGKSSIDNNHIFLNDDKDLWFAFGASHNWCQLDRNLRQYSVRNYGE